MFPPVTSASAPPRAMQPAAPAAAAGSAPMAMPAGATPQVLAFRKALGVPPDQPAPEAKVVAAMSGQLGANVKQMAMGLSAVAPGGAAPAPMDDAAGAGAGAAPSTMPPASAGPSGSSMFSGRDGTPVSDEEMPEEDDEEPTGSSMFGGRK